MKNYSTTVRTGGLIAGLMVGLASTLPSLAADLNVPANYATIQSAVNAASSGDTIRIAPGVYMEQITITNKNLTLIGTPGALIRAKTGMVNTLKPYEAPGAVEVVALLGVAFSDVAVSGLEFEGEHLAREYSPAALAGIYLLSSNGRVDHCAVHGFRAADNVSDRAWGLSTENYVYRGTPVVTVQVLNSVFADNSTSILLDGDDIPNPVNNATLRTQFAVRDNVISGVGPTTDGFQTGIFILVGCAGEVKGNAISDFYHLNADPNDISLVSKGVVGDGTGLQTALQPVRYEGNNFVNNQGALQSKLGNGSQFVNNTFVSNQVALFSMLGDGSQFVNNTFQGRGFSRSDIGLALSGGGAQISGNRFSILGRGVVVLGDDPVFGTAPGIATNATLIGNRFCDVTTPIEIEPLATVLTNQGTLLCPFPPPTLAISPAVLLTWPAVDAGYVVACATNAAGPWVSLGIAPTVTGNEATVAVETTDPAKFFRLQSP